MLSLWKLRVGAESYYLSSVAGGIDEYYSGAGEATGRWVGLASSALNLGPLVTGEDLRTVLAGLNPGTGLTPNGEQLKTWKNRVPGFDLTFSAPKSVSVLYALADPLVRAEVVSGHDEAVLAAVSWLEREACFVRRGSNNRAANREPGVEFGTRRLPGGGFVGAAFRHRTSRAGDPQLHTHVLVANTTRGPDGRWSALDGQALYRSKIAAGAVYQTVLRDEISTRLGVTWGPVRRHLAEIAGVPKPVLRHFSKRRVEIEAELARIGAQGPEAAQAATLATRRAKQHVDFETLDERWQREAHRIGYSPADVENLLAVRNLSAATRLAGGVLAMRTVDGATGSAFESIVTTDEFVVAVARSLSKVGGHLTRHEIQTVVGDHLASGCGVRLLERLTDSVLANDELVPIPEPDGSSSEPRWTTRTVLELEAELLELLSGDSDTGISVDVPTFHRVVEGAGIVLGDDQEVAARQLTTGTAAVRVLVGPAGTGKTHTMAVARHVFEAAGKNVIGVSTSARAAGELEAGSGIESCTIASFRHRADSLTVESVLVVDEAGMCHLEDLVWLLRTARDRGATVILVGDHRQLPEIGAGGGFAAAVRASGLRVARLETNRRQRHRWEHLALNNLRDGDVRAAWEAYVSNDRVHIADSAEAIQRQAIDDWWDAHRAGSDALLVAGTRAQTVALNRLARDRRVDGGELAGPTLRASSIELSVGDRVLLLSNDASQFDLDTQARCRVANGTLATVTDVDGIRGTVDIVERAGRRVRLSAGYIEAGHVTHGYATTIHKAQGATVDDVFVVGVAGLYREAGYVALSRARNGAHLYATTRQASTIGEPHSSGLPLPTERQATASDDVLAALSTSRSKELISIAHQHITAAADLAADLDLAQLDARLHAVTRAERDLAASGLIDPTPLRVQLEAGVESRRHLVLGGRVKALDRDNVGTIEAIDDTTGEAAVTFVSESGSAVTKTLRWHEVHAIDRADLPETAATATEYAKAEQTRIRGIEHDWRTALATRGIGIEDRPILETATRQRRTQIAHHLRADPPDWLTQAFGPRPVDAVGATVWDDEIAHLAEWRDRQQLADVTVGYGPMPTGLDAQATWRDNVERAVATRRWLVDHSSNLEPQPAKVLDQNAIKQRLAELEALFETAPPDQRHIIHRLSRSDDITVCLDALVAAVDTQSNRHDWILENWPHVIEHQELSALVGTAIPTPDRTTRRRPPQLPLLGG